MIELEDSKLESLGESVGLDFEDLAKIKSSKRRDNLSKVNPIYWFGQFLIFLISLFYSVAIGLAKQDATYPFEGGLRAFFLSPFPLTAHLTNVIYSLTGSERSGLSKQSRLLVFSINFSLFALFFYFYFLSIPKIYHSGVMYNVFDSVSSRQHLSQ